MMQRKSGEQNVHNGSFTRRLRRFCAFILLSILACVRLMLPDRSEMTL